MEAETAGDRIRGRHARAAIKKGAIVKVHVDSSKSNGTGVPSAGHTTKAVQRVADAMAALDTTKVSISWRMASFDSGHGPLPLRQLAV
jgi:hypothetical protein